MKTQNITLITGATSGIGKATAEALSEKGHKLIILARNPDKAKALIASLPGEAKFISCDFENLDSVSQAANEVLKQTDHLENLINNAGAIFQAREETAQGFEKHFGVNHLAPFLLTEKLIPLILKSDGRVINVSSDLYKQAKVDFDNLQLQNGYAPMLGYANSKLFNLLHAKELAEKYRVQNLRAYSLHPGVIRSNFGSDFSGGMGFLLNLMKPFMKGTQAGASTSVMLADSERDAFVSGSYFKNKKPVSTKADLVNNDLSKRIWDVSEELVSSYM
ncbi:SDR family NAD(P)-dependent oxidoreductase [Jiulongibacter sediminis]|jgi:NAD(P)-dependent dehydrogenase (short-subunit alcohol dehydrogenase family)|uniref:SDR family NAD(P)-dependent oxidoreductase n=1 Tax=Jiulongibacter sediminis TaxID=1605367 RepID=UPI0026EC8EF4|nr:SDR family NAD(P)-dependent oxidoreductase [Jiulongibacter sediminis]